MNSQELQILQQFRALRSRPPPPHAGKGTPESLLSSAFGQEMLFNTIKLAEKGFLLLESKVTNQIQWKHMAWKLNWCSLCCRKQQIPTEALPGSRRPWWLSNCWNRLPCRQYPQKKGNWKRNKKSHINIKRWKSCWTWGWSCAFSQNKMYRPSWESRLQKNVDFCCCQSPPIPADLFFLTQLFIPNSSRMLEHSEEHNTDFIKLVHQYKSRTFFSQAGFKTH